MPIPKRLLRVSLQMKSGTGDIVTLDENLYMRVKVTKQTFAIQSQAIIDVGGLSQDLRQQLMSQFTAYAKRQRDRGEVNDDYINVDIQAGYIEATGQERLTPIFSGQVTLCDLTSAPPNMILRMTCYTNQIDKTRDLEIAPDQLTFKAYCVWAAGQMGLNADVSTSIDDKIIYNPGRTVYTVAALVADIQRYDRQNVAAWIDDKTLFVRDTNKVVSPGTVIQVRQFVGVPSWVEWGIDFTTMFNAEIRLARAVRLNSKLNPSVNSADLIVCRLEYELATRSDQFYMRVGTAPSAGVPQ